MLMTTDQKMQIDLQFKILLNGPMAIGSGFRRGQIQRTVMRNLQGLPYIPASTLKGRVRDAAERTARTLGYSVCEGPNPRRMCGATRATEDFCLTCRTFGSPGLSSKSGYTGLVWRDAHLEVPLKSQSASAANEAYYYTRTQVQLSRVRATALDAHLFNSENTLENLIYSGRIRGWLPQTTATPFGFAAELILLCGALKMVHFVGGSKSRGLGNCRIELSGPVLVNGAPVVVNNILQAFVDLKPTPEVGDATN